MSLMTSSFYTDAYKVVIRISYCFVMAIYALKLRCLVHVLNYAKLPSALFLPAIFFLVPMFTLGPRNLRCLILFI
jgi:hypothetical protein